MNQVNQTTRRVLMSTITFKGNPIQTSGSLPAIGSQLPNLSITKNDLSDINLADFKGKKIILNIFPSIDTAVCAKSVRRFNEEANRLHNLVILCISADLPFAQSRFCAADN